MDYQEYMQQRETKVKLRERRRWCKDATDWANSTAETLDSSQYTVRILRNQIRAAAKKYAESGSSEDQEAAHLLISQMLDMLEDNAI
ncbi:MAG: hypothetical protein F4X69_02605 [Gemmatimonadetes bacterium]|nr:hypothetical protein [Gemmatimonadota bacterium]